LPTENAEKTDGNPIKRGSMDFDFICTFRPFRGQKKFLRLLTLEKAKVIWTAET
jgi:hypothetical protein